MGWGVKQNIRFAHFKRQFKTQDGPSDHTPSKSDDTLFGHSDDAPICRNPSSIQAFRLFRDGVYNPSSVLCVSKEIDSSPAAVFPNVTFACTNERSVTAFEELNVKTVGPELRKSEIAGRFDLIIDLNPLFPINRLIGYIRSGDYILSTNRRHSADRLLRSPKLEIVAVVQSHFDILRIEESKSKIELLLMDHFEANNLYTLKKL